MRTPSLIERWHAFGTLGALEVAIWAVVSIVVGAAMSWVSRRVLRRLARRTATFDEQFVTRLRGPLAVGWALATAYAGLSALDLQPVAEATARRVLQVTFVAATFWVLLRSIDVADHLISSSGWAANRLASKSFMALARKAIKISVVIVEAVALLSLAGYPVGSLIAGLGIGGLALALGAQKTLENVFGAFALAVDQPFQEGDFVKIDTVMGTIEGIGLRSTRIRTPDRTMVAIPNGKLAEMRTETYATRDRLHFTCTLGLSYATTRDQMGRVLAGVEQALRAQPKLWPDSLTVRLSALAESSLNVDVEAWFTTQDWAEYQRIRQELLLGFMDVVERAGTTLAFPTHTVHVVGPAPQPAR